MHSPEQIDSIRRLNDAARRNPGTGSSANVTIGFGGAIWHAFSVAATGAASICRPSLPIPLLAGRQSREAQRPSGLAAHAGSFRC